jgi:hypothetical protein
VLIDGQYTGKSCTSRRFALRAASGYSLHPMQVCEA